MNKNMEYYKNTIILFLGKFTTQFISFLLIPLFTHNLTTRDYGFVDLAQTYISLLIPIFLLRFDSGVFRFLIDERKNNDDNNKKKIISSSFYIIICIEFILVIVGNIIINFIRIKYYWLILLNIMFLMLSNLLLQVVRGIGDNNGYSISCIITGIINLLINFILIYYFKFNASSILISSTIANLMCSMYIFFRMKFYKYCNRKYIDIKVTKELLKYSLPMIPNGLSWWIVNVSDRTIISIFIGTAMNGIYSLSCKFSNILNNIFAVFNMSWQESASLHINDDDKEEFFTKMINQLLILFSYISLIILAIIPIFFEFLIGNEYLTSYNYIPILLFSNIFNIYTQLIGAIYIAKKMTKQVMNTTLISAMINLTINLLLIRYIGLYAACFSTLIAYSAIAIYRHYDVKKIINIKMDIKSLIVISVTFIISSILFYYNNCYLNYLNLIIIIVIILLMNKKSNRIIKSLKRK